MVDSTPPATHIPQLEQLLSAASQIWTPAQCEVVLNAPDPLSRMTGYHLGWWDARGVPAPAGLGGKGFRGGLTICAAKACGREPSAAARAAAAVELLHNFTLVHDDLMDRDRLRRGRPTVWNVWGDDTAVLVGDGLHAMAVQVLAAHTPAAVAVEMIARLENTVLELCRGQHQDLRFETATEVGPVEYVQMVAEKTGALMGTAAALGAAAAGAPPHQVEALEAFGRELGVGFQIADDILGIWGDPALTGKPVGADLSRRKRSLPVVMALASGTAAAEKLRRLYRPGPALNAVQVGQAVALVESTGAREAAIHQAKNHVTAALSALSAQEIDIAELSVLAHGARQRWV